MPYSNPFEFLNKHASLEVLKRKHVLLLISNLDTSVEEILILSNMYKDARWKVKTPYEIVWIPTVDRLTWNESHQVKFE